MTPQMLTLGRDASDSQVPAAANYRGEEDDDSKSEGHQSWWKSRFGGSPKDDGESRNEYQSLEEKNDSSPPSVEMESTRRKPQQRSKRRSSSIHESLLRDSSSVQDSRPTGLSLQQSPLSREQIVQRDCDFFYRDMQEETTSPRRFSARVLVRERNGVAGISQPAFEYSQAVTVLSPPVLQRYRTRFEQLNRALPQREPDVEDDDYDLRLTATSAAWQQDQIHLTDTVETSSLFFQLKDSNKMLMRLPRDQVRLLMDSDLEVGILSVEQWREDDSDNESAARNARENKRMSRRASFNQRHPPLRYTLTVEDDLYRKIVSEMSDRLTEPFCHSSRCCVEDEKVDIRVAVTILTVVLFVIFLTTIEWPTE